MSRHLSHDQNFKNLILDYPRQALAFFAPEEAAERYLESDNLVARLNLPNMCWSPDRKVEIYARAIEGLLTLEPNIDRQIKYLDFVDIYTGLNDAERRDYECRYPQESAAMTGLAERLRTEGMQQGMQEGGQAVLRKLLVQRFGPLDTRTEQRLQQATTDELERWAERLLDAEALEDVFSKRG